MFPDPSELHSKESKGSVLMTDCTDLDWAVALLLAQYSIMET